MWNHWSYEKINKTLKKLQNHTKINEIQTNAAKSIKSNENVVSFLKSIKIISNLLKIHEHDCKSVNSWEHCQIMET